MTTAAENAHGTLLKLGDGGGPETFTTIAEVGDIGGPGRTKSTHDVTSHDSNWWREFIAGVKDGGQVTLPINYQPTAVTHAALMASYDGNTAKNWQLVHNDSGTTTVAFKAITTDFPLEMPVDGPRKATITLKITGPVTES